MKTICNFGYARSKRGGKSFPNVKGLVRYLQYRNDRHGHIRGAGGPDRWVDGGLGTRYREILRRLDELAPGNKHAYCFSLVISPDPEAMAQVEGDPQARFVDAVQASLAEWEAWRHEHDRQPQAGPLEYSLVVHRPERDYGEQMHAHVILAAATENPLTGERTPLYNNQPHIEALKEIAARQLDHAYGLDREHARAPEPGERDWDDLDEPSPVPDIPFHAASPPEPAEGEEPA